MSGSVRMSRSYRGFAYLLLTTSALTALEQAVHAHCYPRILVLKMIKTHKQKVMSIYRRALKTSLDWTIYRSAWRGQAVYLRSLFEANRSVSDARQQRLIVDEAEKLLREFRHPEPYKVPTAPGGSKFERNLPAPILDPPPKMHV